MSNSSISFVFHQKTIRIVGDSEHPLFVATDVAKALGYVRPNNAVRELVFPEDIFKETVDTSGGQQLMLCVNESGLYALIFGSKLEKAKEFKRWVTSEVLPSIRKTGSYTMPSDTIDVTQQYLVRLAVSRQAKGRGSHYQRIYHSIYDQFKVPRYQELKKADFLKVMQFLNATDLIEETHDKKGVFLPDNIAQQIVNFIYQYRYQFKPLFEAFYRTLCVVQSPVAPTFWESYHDLNLALLEGYMSKNGYSVQSLPSYQKYIANN
mgnify:CR=1 FL=1